MLANCSPESIEKFHLYLQIINFFLSLCGANTELKQVVLSAVRSSPVSLRTQKGHWRAAPAGHNPLITQSSSGWLAPACHSVCSGQGLGNQRPEAHLQEQTHTEPFGAGLGS